MIANIEYNEDDLYERIQMLDEIRAKFKLFLNTGEKSGTILASGEVQSIHNFNIVFENMIAALIYEIDLELIELKKLFTIA